MKNLNNYILEKYSGSSKEYKKIKDLKSGDTIYYAEIKNRNSSPKINEITIEVIDNYEWYNNVLKKKIIWDKVIISKNPRIGKYDVEINDIYYMMGCNNDYDSTNLDGEQSYIINNPYTKFVYLYAKTKVFQFTYESNPYYWNAWATTKEELEEIIKNEYEPDSQYNSIIQDKQEKIDKINNQIKELEDKRNKLLNEIAKISKKMSKK